jgi:signal transduction histidine kinase
MMLAMVARVERTRSLVALGLWAATALIGVGGIILTALAWPDLKPSDSYTAMLLPFAGATYATLGALIVRRAGNRIGWMLLGEGLGSNVIALSSAYAIVGVLTHPGALPGPKVVGAISEVVFVPVVTTLELLLVVFPSGLLPSRRWRPFAVGAVGLTVVAVVGFIVSSRQVEIPAPGGVSLQFPNPLAIRSLGHGVSTTLLGTLPSFSVFAVLLFAAAAAALVVRYRSGDPVLRQQIKWVASLAAAAVVSQAVLAIAFATGRTDSPAVLVAGLVSALVILIGIPLAITTAILKYGLYQIDVIINRTVVYGLLAAAATAVYLTVVVGIGSLVGYGVGNPLLTTAAAVAIALLLQPLRRQAQRVANRLVYGERATPYQVLSDFAESMAGTLAIDDVLDRMVSVLADGTGAVRADVWIRVGPELRPVATWPPDGARPDALAMDQDGELTRLDGATRAVAVRQGEEMLGALAIQKARNEPLSTTEDKLLHDLASQAGLVLRNVRLTAELRTTIEELRASRRRLVEAQDAERRKIERNLHDGAQQQLVALGVQLGLLGRLAGDPGRVERMARQLQDALQEALNDLRDLARGIYPPLLADQGLVVALEAQARKGAVPTTVEFDGVGRYAEQVEAAVYFCALEAMQNVAKYARANSTILRLIETDGYLQFEIEDNGGGFEPDKIGHGTGLQGMADRLDAIGGTLEVASQPGRGTLVRGRIRLT